MPNAQIGELIGRDKSVVCREVVRNRGTDGSYWGRSRTGLPMSAAGNTKRSSLSRIRTWCRQIETWMDDGWSAGLIAQVWRHDNLTQARG